MKTKAFLTDGEFEALFGAQVAEAIDILGNYAEGICQACGGECCARVRCEFYSDRFDACPIHEYRPAKCRLHHCDRVLENGLLTQEERQLLNRPAENVSDVLRHTWGMNIFLEPPVRVGGTSWLGPLGIEHEVQDVIRAFEKGKLDGGTAKARLLGMVQQARTGQERGGASP